jgi:NUMOD3 motif
LEIVEECVPEERFAREQHWMDICGISRQRGYNANPVARGTPRGRPKSEEMKRKLSLINKGKRHSEATLEKLRIARRGKKPAARQERARALREA